MRAVKQGLLWALVTATGAAAEASTVHKVRFAQPAQILVWEDGDLIARGGEVLLAGAGTPTMDQIPGDGRLVPIEHGWQGQRVISVASNTAFSVKTHALGPTDEISVRLLGAQENAQVRGGETADALFRQSAKTAIRPGAPASQAIELEISWTGDHAPDVYLIAD